MKYLTLNRTPLRDNFDRIFDDFWGMQSLQSALPESRWQPAAEIEEGEDHYQLTLDIPGVKKEDLKIEVEKDQVMVSGERKESAARRGGLYSERRFGAFSRSFSLPSHVDASKIEARYADGVLQVLVPKAEAAKPRLVPISDSSGK